MFDRFFRLMTVRRRITGGFLILMLLVIVSIPLTIANYNFLLNRLQQVSDEARGDRLLLLASIRIASSRVNLTRYIQDYAPSPYEALDDVEQATQLLLEARSMITSPEQKESVTVVLDALAGYKTLIIELEAARQSGEGQAASRFEFQTFRLGSDIGQRIEQIVKQSEARVAAANEAVYTETQLRLTLFIVSYIGLSALAMIFSTLIARSITRPIAELQKGAEALLQGRMETVIPVSGSGELSLLARTFNQLAAELSELYHSLEQRIADRTRRLEIIATLSERLSAILNLEELLYELVDQVKESFGYYHAHVYLVDDQRRNLVMIAGVGEAGRAMKARGHSIPLNAPTSLVARAARSGKIVSVDNVREAEDWLPNPLLPDTYSEMAVPIILKEQVVGVLDVQENEIAGLDEGDANLLRSLASQVAVAIRNARLFDEVETALAKVHAAQERYLERSWKRAKSSIQGEQYHYIRPNVPVLDEATLVEAERQALAQDRPTIITFNDNQTSEKLQKQKPRSVVAPIMLRDQTIGTLYLHPVSDDQQWTEDDLALVEVVVDQLAQTAESLRLFEETHQRAGQEQTIREITDKLRQAPTLEILTRTASEELSKALGVSHSLVKVGTTGREAQPQDEAPQIGGGYD